MARRRKSLSEDDLAHWRAVAATTEPLRPGAPEPESPPQARPKRKPEPPDLQGLRLGAARKEPLTSVSLASDAVPQGARQIDRRIADRLHRGRLRPEAALDLHGMTADAAHSALNGFIIAAQDSGRRLVLVITGKGRTRLDETGPVIGGKGVLRHSVPHWLSQPVLRERILQVTAAHNRHGGGGALYVYLRRRR